MAISDQDRVALNEFYRQLRNLGISRSPLPDINLGDVLQGAISLNVFGDGSDGSVVLDGVTTYPFATLAGSTYTLTKPVYATNLVLPAGITLKPALEAIFVTDTFTLNGTIDSDGNAAVGSAGGVALGLTDGTKFFGIDHSTVPGITTALSSQAGGNTGNDVWGGPTGGGGKTDGTQQPVGTRTAGASPCVYAVNAVKRNTYFARAFSPGFSIGSPSAGRGSGDGANAGGGAGGAGGTILIYARRLVVGPSASIHAIGGVGGSTAAGNTGGGGGGGGGSCFVYSQLSTGTPLALGTNVNLSGGAGGTGFGTGAAGTPGGVGLLTLVTLS